MTTHPRLAKLPLTLLCGLLLAGTVSAQAANPTAQTASPTAQAASPTAQAAGGQDALKCYRDANVSFLYPKSWINEFTLGPHVPGVDPYPTNVLLEPTNILFENDNMISKMAKSTHTLTLTKDQLLVGVYAGSAEMKFFHKYNASDSALTMLEARTRSDTTTVIEAPETIKLISTDNAAQEVRHNGTDDTLEILLAFSNHPVSIVGLVAVGQVPVYQSIIQGIASTVQAGVDFTKITSPDMLCETFTNKALTVRYPSGWFVPEPTNPSATVSITNVAYLNVSKPLTSGEFETTVTTGSQVYSMSGAAPSSAPSPSDLISKLKAQMIDGPHAELDKIDQPVAVTIGGQPGAEAAITAKGGVSSGYVIAFYQNKQPVVLIGLTANADAPAYRALFEQIAASVTLNSP